MDIHVFFETGTSPADRLAALTQAINQLTERIETMSQDLSQLKAAVAANTSVIGSAVALIQGMAEKLQAAIDAGADPAELQALADELKAQDAALAAAVSANTPSEPAGDGASGGTTEEPTT